jgi:putative glutamine amidotransferase
MKKYNKPIIGIVSKQNTFCDYELYSQQIVYDGVRCAILNNGGITIGVLPTQAINRFNPNDEVDNTELTNQEKEDLHSLIDLCDGIILEGGLSSASYEVEVAKYAIKKDIPLLGICAGFNIIIRSMGGTPFFMKEKHIHNQEDGKYAHKNKIIKDTLLYKILENEDISVNSVHTMFAREEDVKGLEISAFSEDGYVEAVELSSNRFVLGLKWHPEMMIDYDKSMNKIFKEFINVCK